MKENIYYCLAIIFLMQSTQSSEWSLNQCMTTQNL